MLRAYKYRIYPNEEQAAQLRQFFGGCRYVYNWALEMKNAAYEAGEKSPSVFEINKRLTGLKKSESWLYEIPGQSLQFAIRNLDSAYKHFYRRLKMGGVEPGFPRFRSRHGRIQSFQFIQSYHVNFDSQTVKIPKMNSLIRAVIDRPIPENGVMKTATVSMTKTGRYFISVLVDDGIDLPEPEPFDEKTTVGIDVGIASFATFSDGAKIPNPKHLQNSEKRLKCLQRRLSRKKRGSKNRNKARLRVARMHEKIANQRRDFHHKLSNTIVSENQAIAVETLNVNGMMKNRHLAKSVSDVGWSQFVEFVEYKCRWRGKTLMRIGQFEPSSKLCSKCGYKLTDMKLSDRVWTCPDCGTVHDRDVNAAKNIKQIALNQHTGQKLSGEPVESSASAGAMKQEPRDLGNIVPSSGI